MNQDRFRAFLEDYREIAEAANNLNTPWCEAYPYSVTESSLCPNRICKSYHNAADTEWTGFEFYPDRITLVFKGEDRHGDWYYHEIPAEYIWLPDWLDRTQVAFLGELAKEQAILDAVAAENKATTERRERETYVRLKQRYEGGGT